MEVSSVRATPDHDGEIDAARSAGDQRRVLALLMARYGDGIYRFAMAMTRDRSLAQEVRQQVFVDAFRDLGHLGAGASPRNWIFGIARHRCLDALDARARWNRRYKNDPPPEPSGDDQGDSDDGAPDRALDRGRLAGVLAGCLDKLAPAAREAVILRYQQELSYDEAAAIAGEPSATLRKRVARALPVLRRCVQAQLHRGDHR